MLPCGAQGSALHVLRESGCRNWGQQALHEFPRCRDPWEFRIAVTKTSARCSAALPNTFPI
jgi:hypothetical protein